MKNNGWQKKAKARHERGIALVAVMLALLLITAMAAGIIILTNTETNTSSNFRDEQRAFFAAKAGIEEARDRLRKNLSDSLTRPTGLPGSGSSSVLYLTNPLNSSDTVQPWCGSGSGSCSSVYADDELCNETLSGSAGCTLDTNTNKTYPSGSYYTKTTADTTTYAPSTGAVLDWKWARVTLKQNNAFGAGYYVNGSSSNTSQVYWNGNSECVSGSTCTLPVYIITSLAVTPSGSRRMVQMEVAEDQLNFTAPAALTLDGTSDQFSGGNASGWAVVGTDTAVAGCGGGGTGAAVPAIGVSDGAPATGNGKGANAASGDVANVINGYGTGSGIPNKNVGSYVGLGGAPDIENVSSTYVSNKLDTISDIQSLVSTLKNNITQPVVAGGTKVSGSGYLFNSGPVSPSTIPNPQIVYANGDLTLSGSSTGYGILVVTGTLTMKGNVNWNGIILVVGTGNLQTDGTNQFNGAVVVANTSSGSIGAPTFSVNGGGNGNVSYSSACIAQATQLSTFHSVSFRELMN
jgi:Tfp pilus assembly protein PilX